MYLALGSGLPRFRQGFTCPAVLRRWTKRFVVSPTGLSPSLADLSRIVSLPRRFRSCPFLQPRCFHNGLGCSPFARHYLGNNLFSSGYLDVSVPPVPSPTLCVQIGVPEHDFWWVSPFGYPRILRLHTAPRGFSQCTTSFFGIYHQGIHRMLLVAYSLIRRS